MRTMRTLVVGPMMAVGIWVASTHAQCVGDCDGDGGVTVDEILVGVNIALNQQVLEACVSFDQNEDGEVTIDEIVYSVGKALSDCRPEFVQAAAGISTATVAAVESVRIIDFGYVGAGPTDGLTAAVRFNPQGRAGPDLTTCLCPGGGTVENLSCTTTAGTSVLSATLRDCRQASDVRNGQLMLTVEDPDFCTSCLIPLNVSAAQVLSEFSITVPDTNTTYEIARSLTESFTLTDQGCAGVNRRATYDGVVQATGAGTDVTFSYKPLDLTVQSALGSDDLCTTATTKSGRISVDDQVNARRFVEDSNGFGITETALAVVVIKG